MAEPFTRRQFLYLGGLLLVGTLVDSSLGWATGRSALSRRRTLWSMGGWNILEVDAASASVAEHALREAVATVRRVDQTFSTFDSRSLFSRVNAEHSGRVPIDNDNLLHTIDQSLRVAQDTHGHFDPTVEPLMHRWGFRDFTQAQRDERTEPVGYKHVQCDFQNGYLERDCGVALDPGGWAKGYAAEMAVQAALRSGASAAQANCGCDIFRSGSMPWECSIRDPAGVLSDIALRCSHHYHAVATSANNESFRVDDSGRRIGHIMNPRTGRPAQSDIESVTVFTDDGLTADALSSALFVMGTSHAAKWLDRNPRFGAVIMPTGWRQDPALLVIRGKVDVHLTDAYRSRG